MESHCKLTGHYTQRSSTVLTRSFSDFNISLASSIPALLVEFYCVLRCLYILLSPSARLRDEFRVIYDVRIVQGYSLLLLDSMVLLASSSVVGAYGRIVPVVVASIMVMSE